MVVILLPTTITTSCRLVLAAFGSMFVYKYPPPSPPSFLLPAASDVQSFHEGRQLVPSLTFTFTFTFTVTFTFTFTFTFT